VPTFVKQAVLAVVTVIGSGLQRIQPIWVEDVAEYLSRAGDRSAGRRQNVRARRTGHRDLGTSFT